MSVNTQQAFQRVINMQREHGFFIVALMEPFQNCRHIQRYRIRLGMDAVMSNINGKIWLLFDVVIEWEDSLYYLASDMELPWIVGGDFNFVMSEAEKLGGLPVYLPEYEDFVFCVNSCRLFDLGYKGIPFTWWNGKPNSECIFKRLDRIFVNLPFQNLFPSIEVEHLIRTCSDHAPLLMSCGEEEMQFIDIREDIVRVKEMLFEDDPTIENRIVLQKAQDELTKYISIGEQYWKQKESMNWFAEGDRNTSFFHNHVNGKRQKLQLKRIHNGDGGWLESQVLMADAVVDIFKKYFTHEGDPTSFELLNNVNNMVTMDQNLELCKFPTIEEVKGADFALSGDSASGPDGFTGLFYQQCWDIVG
ncbi:uncharacterized protein LOC107793013 [Nicotiana tabacum]|uniref:Uncharacterized protein LOC107793013 n=1 Tax=Nicotiana tabacum TaxID=4097 RepID=A0AC58S8L3_TOBAC